MKVLLFADSHLGFDFPIRPRISRRRRGSDFFKNYQHVLDVAVDEGVDVLLHGGDMFFRSKIPAPIISKAYEPLIKPLDHGIDILIVPGNHERSRLPLSPVFHHPKLHIFDYPRTHIVKREGIATAFGGIPNIRNNVAGTFRDAYAATGLESLDAHIKILCLHQAIESSRVGVQNYQFQKGRDVIALDMIPDGLDLVASGHIHRPQVIYAQNNTPIIYPGAIERTSFAERLEAKGFFIINIGLESLDWDFRQLPIRPMFEIIPDPNLNTKPSLLHSISEQLSDFPEDSIVRVKYANEHQVALLKIAELRELIVPTMNIDISVLHQNRKVVE